MSKLQGYRRNELKQLNKLGLCLVGHVGTGCPTSSVIPPIAVAPSQPSTVTSRQSPFNSPFILCLFLNMLELNSVGITWPQSKWLR